METLHLRHACIEDAVLLAPLNAQLIQDEGHRNAMTVHELAERMAAWLRADYRAAIFEVSGSPVGYALYRVGPEHVYLRQLFVRSDFRRRGFGRQALEWLWRNSWAGAPRLRIDVLVGNTSGAAFWRAVGFKDYCLTMEMERPIDI
ncbi:GNAT family N-acetyltransferase [Betaproteobacteria bacterium GR16-43]|nr:GNAT family N-acetyltransferase [Betaproteobacteria bacterium GR16-43]